MNKKIPVQIKRIEPMQTFTCQHCGDHFQAPVRCWYSLWCSPACRQAAYRARIKLESMMEQGTPSFGIPA